MNKVACGQCGEMIDDKDLDAHWLENHSKRIKGTAQRNPGQIANSRADTSSTTGRWRTCPTCGVQVKEANFDRHRKKAHLRALTKAEKKAAEKAVKKKKQKSGKDISREYDRPLDFLDLPNVISGGGFGVGKRRK